MSDTTFNSAAVCWRMVRFESGRLLPVMVRRAELREGESADARAIDTARAFFRRCGQGEASGPYIAGRHEGMIR